MGSRAFSAKSSSREPALIDDMRQVKSYIVTFVNIRQDKSEFKLWKKFKDESHISERCTLTPVSLIFERIAGPKRLHPLGFVWRDTARKRIPLMKHWFSRKQSRRLDEAGFTLMELLIVISIMLILMLIAIPNMLNLRSQANETSAIQSLRAIYQSEIQYQTNYPANGFACTLQTLGGDASNAPGPQNAQLLQRDLSSGSKAGYSFNVGPCSKTTVNNQDMYTSFEVTAVPQAVGKTGHRGFCMDMTGEIKADPTGGTNCTVPLQ